MVGLSGLPRSHSAGLSLRPTNAPYISMSCECNYTISMPMESKVNFNKPSKNSTRFVNKDSFNILQSAQGLTEFHLWHVMVVLM